MTFHFDDFHVPSEAERLGDTLRRSYPTPETDARFADLLRRLQDKG